MLVSLAYTQKTKQYFIKSLLDLIAKKTILFTSTL